MPEWNPVWKADGGQELEISEMDETAKYATAKQWVSMGLLVYSSKYNQILLLFPWFCPFWSLSSVLQVTEECARNQTIFLKDEERLRSGVA